MAFIYDLTDTWNAGGTTFNAIKMNVTDTASAAASKLVTLQVGGSERFGVRKDGQGYFAGSVGIGTALPAYNLHVNASSGNPLILVGGGANNTGGLLFGDDVGNLGGQVRYAHNVDAMYFITSGSERMRITSAGFVGIGTSAPSAKLHVIGPSNGSLARFGASVPDRSLQINQFAIDGVNEVGYDFNAPGHVSATPRAALSFSTLSTERMRITDTGNVGIGTSSPNASISTLGGFATLEAASFNRGAMGSGIKVTLSSASYSVLATDKPLGLGTTGAFEVLLSTNNAERMRIDSSGNVGIGTSSPNVKLHVEGGQIRSSGGYIVSGAGELKTSLAGSGIALNSGGANGIAFETGGAPGTERMRITSGGNVGIGTSSPTRKVTIFNNDATNNTSVPTLSLHSDRNDRGVSLDVVRGALSSVIGLAISTSDGADPVERMRISPNGNVGIGTTGPANRLAVQNDTAPTFFDTTLDNTAFLICNRGAGDGNFGASLGFSRLDSVGRVNAAIAIKQTSADADQCGMSFFTHASASTGVALQESMTITHAGNVGINEAAPDYRLDVNGAIGFTPGASVTPVDNGDVVFELTNNTTLTIKAKGSDGVVRSGTITLA